MANLIRFGVSVDEDLLESFDKLTGHQNRSEAIRDLMRDALIRDRIDGFSDSIAIGSLTVVYDHHATGLLDEMSRIQHRYHDQILSVMHMHVGHDDCLEIIAFRGAASSIIELSNSLLGLKGIKNGKLFLTLPSSAIN